MGWFATSIKVDDEKIVLNRGVRSQSMLWSRVTYVFGEKTDKVTYEELFLIIEEEGGLAFELGELDEGFRDFEAMAPNKLEGFAVDWRQRLEPAEPGIRDNIWHKDGWSGSSGPHDKG